MTTLTREDITDTVRRYLDRHPGEQDHLAELVHAMNRGAEVHSRHQFDGGHVTCGAVVLDHHGRLLLIRHRTLGSWLLPGGHLEPGDNGLLYAALRELEEETGIAWQEAVSPPGQDVLPIDIDLHHIPANPSKGEPAHWHADFRYAFWVKEPKVTIQLDEVDGYQWRSPAEAPTAKLVAKLAQL